MRQEGTSHDSLPQRHKQRQKGDLQGQAVGLSRPLNGPSSSTAVGVNGDENAEDGQNGSCNEDGARASDRPRQQGR